MELFQLYNRVKQITMKKILIGGGTGLIGQRLLELIDHKEFEVAILSRKKRQDDKVNYLVWDLDTGTMDLEGFQPDIVINLTGAGIADKLWTKKRKEILISSRVKSTALLEKAIVNKDISPEVFLSASAVGYYGNRGEEKLTEESKSGDEASFLVYCCQMWEAAVDKIKPLTSRIIKLRIGIVLSTKGGALEKILLPMNFGIAGYFGNGKQYYPWIHIDDVCGSILHLVQDKEANGIYNGVSPQPMPLKEMTVGIKKGIKKWALVLPVPAFVLKLVMGEMSSMLLNSTRAIPKRLMKEGYQYKFTDIENAVADLKEHRK